MDNPKNLDINDNKFYYLISLGWAIFVLVNTMSFGLFIGGLAVLLYIGLSYIYMVLLMIKFHYNWVIPRVAHVLLITCIIMLTISITSVGIGIALLALVFSVPSAFIGGQFLAIHPFSMHLHYNETNRLLSITYNKIFFDITEEVYIPEDTLLKIIATTKFPLIPSRKNMFHVLQINRTKVFIAPTSLNGFSLINKIITLLPHEKLQIGYLPPTNARLFLPRTHGTLTLPSSLLLQSYYELSDLPKFTNSPNFEQLSPRGDSLAKSKSILIIVSLLAGLNYIFYITTMSILGLTTEIPFFILRYYIGIGIFILAILIIVIRNALAIWFGKFDLIMSEKLVTLTYNFTKKVEINIHRSLNPLLIIENNILFLIILNDGLGFYYKHRIGLVADDFSDMKHIISNE